MDITVSTPGSPGTSFTDSVKDQIVIMFDVMNKHSEYKNLREFGKDLEEYGINWDYGRNILPFMQNCGLVKYKDSGVIDNDSFFTNIGNTYVDVLKTIQLVKKEDDSETKQYVLSALEKIQESIYFQALVIMMKKVECNYSQDFFDVLCFARRYGYIDKEEYLLLQYERENHPGDYLTAMNDTVEQYRAGQFEIRVKTKTRNGESGEVSSVNSFPYVNGNFMKSGVLRKESVKKSSDRYCIVAERLPEVDIAIQEVKNARV